MLVSRSDAGGVGLASNMLVHDLFYFNKSQSVFRLYENIQVWNVTFPIYITQK